MSKKITTEELQQAFDLAYLLHPRADVALRVTIDACDFLAGIDSTQARRRRSINHYKAAIPHEQRLQQAVYVVSYRRELDQESPRPWMTPKYTPTREDLIVRYVKHIIWKNSLLHCRNLAVGIGCLLYSYQPSEIAELLGFYEENNLRKIKARIAKDLRDRFSNAGIVRPNGRSIRTIPANENDRLLVQQTLEALTPWQSSHLPPATPETLILETLFDENNPLSEWKRKHALIDPGCAGLAHLVNEYNNFFASISIRRRLADPLEMLVLPDFAGNPTPPQERFKRRLLSENEKMLLKERHRPSGPWAYDPNTLCLFLSRLDLTESCGEDPLTIGAHVDDCFHCDPPRSWRRGVSVVDSSFRVVDSGAANQMSIGRPRKHCRVDPPVTTKVDSVGTMLIGIGGTGGQCVSTLAASAEESGRGEEDATFLTITPVTRTACLPLSFAQQRLWFINQLNPESAAYNLPLVVRLIGRLDVPALERTLEEIVQRHENLRTTFREIDGEPLQVISETTQVSLPLTDLSHLSEPEREAEAQRLIKEEAARPFNLAQSAGRSALLKLGEEEHVALVTMHHIVSDGWSMGVLIREVGILYEAFTSGTKAELSELAIQYADYAAWQREWLTGEVVEEQLEYWKQQLGEELPVLPLPLDHARPPVPTQRGAMSRWGLSAETSKRLKELSRREGATLFMTLLAAFDVLLARYTGQQDIVIGIPIAGRNRPETKGLIGFFINTLVLRTDLRGDPTFCELLQRVREVTLGAQRHQDMPFEKLVEELQPECDMSHTPLFQVGIALQNVSKSELELGGLQLRQKLAENNAAKFDLTVALEEDEGVLRGVFNYNTDLFDASTIERMIEHFRNVLDQVTQYPERRISELRLLSDEEKQQQLVAWNAMQVDCPQQSIPALFEAQVERAPKAIALVFGDEALSYEELNRRANQLAHYLRHQGVGPEVLVGVMVECSVELVVSLVAILKAGGAYVLLDSEYSAERLAFVLTDADLRVLLITERLSRVVPQTAAQVICLDRDSERIAAASTENLTVNVQPEDLAYVIYTSGSTGIPKGVTVPHRAVIRLVKETDYIRFAADEVFLQQAPVSFDASSLELWGSLLNGVRTVMRLIDLRGVRQSLAGGDVLSPAHMQRLLSAVGGSVLVNGYGPTEKTTFSYTHRMASCWELAGSSVPIGRPIKNTQVYVLDERLESVPIGVAGELYLGGAGLAREYLRRPELTAEKFVPHPYSIEPGARLYRTSDQVRWLADGTLEFIGRIDQQVKLRGFRVELGEIESVLNEHEAVLESVGVARTDEPGERRLVAYVVAEQTISASELRSYLRERLPDYMVPSAFVQMESLLLTANGKVNCHTLPAPEQESGEGRTEYVAPRIQIEELLCEIWAEVLKLERVSIADNFFDLGGHSLLATQLVSRVRAAFEVELPLLAFFEAPTVRWLAETIEQIGQHEKHPTVLTIEPVTRDGWLPLPFAQEQLRFIDQMTLGSAAYNVPLAVRLPGRLDAIALECSLNAIAQRHESLRTTFMEVDGEPVQVTYNSAEVPLTDLNHLQEAERLAEGGIKFLGRIDQQVRSPGAARTWQSRPAKDGDVGSRRDILVESWPGTPPMITSSVRAGGTFLAQQLETRPRGSTLGHHPFVGALAEGRYNCRPQQKKNQRGVDRSRESIVQLLGPAQPPSWCNRALPESAIHA